AVALFAEFAHALSNDFWFLLRVLEAFFVGTFFVANKLEEEWDVVSTALVAKTLDPGMLDVVDRLGIERRVVEEDLHAVGALFFGQGLLQRTALIHGGGGDYTTFVGNGFQTGKFSGAKLHKSSDECAKLAGKTDRPGPTGRPNIVIRGDDGGK